MSMESETHSVDDEALHLNTADLEPSLEQLEAVANVDLSKQLSKDVSLELPTLDIEKPDKIEFSLRRSASKNKREHTCVDPTMQYLSEIGLHRLLTHKEEIYLARATLKGDGDARKRLVEANLRLVVKMAKHYSRSKLPFIDLISEGNIGLLLAVDRFNPELGFKFSTYATWWIRQCIERAIMDQGREIRVPVHIQKAINAYHRANRELSKKLNREPTPEEIAAHIDCSVEDIQKRLSALVETTSLDQELNLDGEPVLKDILPDKNSPSPEQWLQDQDLQTRILELLSRLEERCQVIIRHRYGLMGAERLTLVEVGKLVNLTRERVRQLEALSLDYLRRHLRDA